VWPYDCVDKKDIIMDYENCNTDLKILFRSALDEWILYAMPEQIKSFVKDFSGSPILLGKRKFYIKFVDSIKEKSVEQGMFVHTCFWSADVSLKTLKMLYKEQNSDKNKTKNVLKELWFNNFGINTINMA
jgi:hypothetical protein